MEGLRADPLDVIAIDGKTSRRSHARSKGRLPLQTVSAWATRQRRVLGQETVSEKFNEIMVIPLLLRRRELTGALVTIDAMGTPKEIAQTIIDGGGDHVLASKENWPATLCRGCQGAHRSAAPRYCNAARRSMVTMAGSKPVTTPSAMISTSCYPTDAIRGNSHSEGLPALA